MKLFSNLVFEALFRSATILLRKMAGCFTLNLSWLSMSIPHGAKGKPAVCDISWSYSVVESIIAGNQVSIKENDVYARLATNVNRKHYF